MFRYKPPRLSNLVSLDVKEFVPQMVTWCNINLSKYWCYDSIIAGYQYYTFYFESEADRTMFILKWE